MKNITAVLKHCKLVDTLFGIRERQIYNALDNAKMNIEEQIANARIEFENNLEKLGEKDANYKSIINSMLKNRETIQNGQKSLDCIEDIRKELEEEAEIDESEDEKKK